MAQEDKLKKTSQVCMADPAGIIRDKVMAVRQYWLQHNPHDLSPEEMYRIRVTAPISGTVALIIGQELDWLKGNYDD